MATMLNEKLKFLRKEKKLTLEGVANEVDSSRSYIWELENKPLKRPSATKLGMLAKLYEVTTEFLLDDEQTSMDANNFEKAFFRRFQKLPTETQKKLNDIMKVLEQDKDG